MQEIINAMLKIILDDGSQAKPMYNAIRRWNDMFVEFHSWYTFFFDNDSIRIHNSEKGVDEKILKWTQSKMSPEFLAAVKDWLNLDFNSWITIEDEDESVDDSEAWAEDDWASEENTKQEEKKEVKRQVPSSWAKKK